MEKELNIPEGTEVTEPLKIYLNEIGQIPLLDAEEEKELGAEVWTVMKRQDGDWKKEISGWLYQSPSIIPAEGSH